MAWGDLPEPMAMSSSKRQKDRAFVEWLFRKESHFWDGEVVEDFEEWFWWICWCWFKVCPFCRSFQYIADTEMNMLWAKIHQRFLLRMFIFFNLFPGIFSEIWRVASDVWSYWDDQHIFIPHVGCAKCQSPQSFRNFISTTETWHLLFCTIQCAWLCCKEPTVQLPSKVVLYRWHIYKSSTIVTSTLYAYIYKCMLYLFHACTEAMC